VKNDIRGKGIASGTSALISGLVVSLATPSYAVSIGTPQFDSHLTQALNLKIPVRDHGTAVQVNAYSARLLTGPDYDAVGLDRPGHPIDDFTVLLEAGNSDQFWVKILSSQPIREPILTLLLELSRGQETLIRQIDLLLDPPLPMARKPAPEKLTAEFRADTAPALAATIAPLLTTQPVLSNAALAPRAMSKQNIRALNDIPPYSASNEQYGPIRDGESLSRIAQRARPDQRISIAKMAAALKHYNPQAFFGSMHELRVGVMLRVPSQDEIASFDRDLAWYKNTPDAREPSLNQAREWLARDTSAPSQRHLKSGPQLQSSAHYHNGRFLALDLKFQSYLDLLPHQEKVSRADLPLQIPGQPKTAIPGSDPASKPTLHLTTVQEPPTTKIAKTTRLAALPIAAIPATGTPNQPLPEPVKLPAVAALAEQAADAAPAQELAADTAAAIGTSTVPHADGEGGFWWWLLLPAGLIGAFLVQLKGHARVSAAPRPLDPATSSEAPAAADSLDLSPTSQHSNSVAEFPVEPRI
jgi:FimV-like protein